jgi:EAL domain-containing protein (putative c-di-GMP-specific phosphodiesterase class I)
LRDCWTPEEARANTRRSSPISGSKPTATADKSARLSISTSRNVVGLPGMSRERWGCERQIEAVASRSSRERRGLAVGAAVEAALRQERLLFAFQPVVCAATGKVDYFECLLRMRDEKGDIVSGGEFITVVEELGWIGLIDRYVLKKTVRALAADPEVRLGFNISGMTAGDRPWLRSLTSLLRHHRDIARRLVVEITETAALGDIAESARFVDVLHHSGCRVALDDFGAGHTSLRQLQILPVDIVKIDGSLVGNLRSRPQTRMFLRYLLGLIRSFGLTTVAECVENAEDAALLRAEGIGYLQGHHFGRPTIGCGSLRTAEFAVP